MKVFSQLESAQIENVVADPTPTATTVGRVIYRTDTDEYKICDATPAWRTIFSSLDGSLTFTGIATPGTNPAAGKYKLYFKTDGKAYYLDENGIELPLGSGGGSGFNYVDNGEADADTSGWSTYANTTAGVRPDDFGGTPAGLTFTRDTVAPLVGGGSFKLVKDAVNRQGQGIYTSFSNETGHATLKMLLEMFTDSSDANIADGDLAIYLVGSSDSFVADFQVVEPNNPDILAGVKELKKQMQLLPDDLDYRLCIHVKSVNATAYTFYFDEVVLGPKGATSSAPITDWIPYTPVLTNPTNATATGYYRRVGDSIEINVYIIWSSSGSGSNMKVGYPSGLVADTAKLADSVQQMGAAHWGDGGTIKALEPSATSTGIQFGEIGTGNAWDGSQAANGDTVEFFATIPIVGFTSNVKISEDLGARDVSVLASGNGGGAYTANTAIEFTTKSKDTTNSWDGSTFTAPASGFYAISGGVNFSASLSSTIFIYVNGSSSKVIGRNDTANSTLNFAGHAYFNKGDLVTVRSNVAGTLTNSSSYHTISIQKLATPQSMLESEIVAARYTSDSGQTANNAEPIEFEDVDHDSHNAYNISNGKYTVPVSGKYLISSHVTTVSQSWTVGEFFGLSLLINGTILGEDFANLSASANVPLSPKITEVLDLVKGDEIEIEVTTDNNTTLATDGEKNAFSIARIK